MQRVEARHRPILFDTVSVLSWQISVPGKTGARTAHSSARSGHSKRLTFHQDLRLQGSNGKNLNKEGETNNLGFEIIH